MKTLKGGFLSNRDIFFLFERERWLLGELYNLVCVQEICHTLFYLSLEFLQYTNNEFKVGIM
jgi:hypothetical protein